MLNAHIFLTVIRYIFQLNIYYISSVNGFPKIKFSPKDLAKSLYEPLILRELSLTFLEH